MSATTPVPPAPKIGTRQATLLFLLAIAVRLVATAVVGFSTLKFADARAYLFAARSLAETGTYPQRTELYFFRPPGYPAFLVAATLGHPRRIALAKIGDSLVGALTVLLLSRLSARIFRRRRLALATGVVAALHPSFVLMATEIQSETLFLFLLLGSALLLVIAVDRPSSNAALVSGLLLGAAALTRSIGLALGPFLLTPLGDRRYPLRARWHLAAAALLGFAVALAPWTIRNAIVFHEFIPVSDAGGYIFYQGNSRVAREYYNLRSRREYEEWLPALDHDTFVRLRDMEESGKTSPSQRSSEFTRLALQQIRSDPSGALQLFGQKTWQWIRPYPTPWFWPLPVVIGVGAWYLALETLTLVGLWTARRRGIAVFCAVFLVFTMAIHVLLTVVWRYRVPYWDPVLLLFGVFAVGRRFGNRESAENPGPTPGL